MARIHVPDIIKGRPIAKLLKQNPIRRIRRQDSRSSFGLARESSLPSFRVEQAHVVRQITSQGVSSIEMTLSFSGICLINALKVSFSLNLWRQK